jgi:DNA-binding GntR family transcriptional regulator
MGTISEHDDKPADESISAAEDLFHDALVRSHQNRNFIGEVEAAAAQYCREMRRRGRAPEQVLKDAKRVISDAIDGDDVPVAERAVLSCIQHYYRAD